MIRVVNRLGAEKLLPITMSMPDVPFALSIPTQTLPGGHGAIRTGRETIQQRQITISGVIYHHDKEAIRQELDSLLPFLLEPPLQVYRQHTDSRFLWARLLSAPQQWIGGDAELHLSITLLALDPYWYGPEVTVTVTGTQTIEVEGSASAFPVIRTVGSVSGLAVTNATTGQTVTVTGLSEPGVIEIDCANYTCTVDGTSRLDLVGDDWVASGFELVPGDNEITTTEPVELIYRPRWY
jgi:phage-related protein